MSDSKRTRRFMLAAPLSACVFPLSAAAAETPPTFSDQEALAILAEEGEPLKGIKAKAIINSFWSELPPNQQPKLAWPADDAAYDYVHLVSAPNSDTPFDLTPAVLETYFDACGYSKAISGDIVLFGLRGAALADGTDWSAFAGRQSIRDQRPDHIHARCLIGVFDRPRKLIAIAR